MVHRRSFLIIAAACLPGLAVAQKFPTKPVTLVVAFAPGGATDIMARIIAPRLGARLGTEVVVDNRSGGGGLVAMNSVSAAPPDGHTLLIVDTSFATIAALSPERRVAPFKDLVPVSIVATAPYVIATNPTVPAKTLQEFIALARSKPGEINYGSGGLGSATHLAGEWFKSLTGTDILHVPYRGGGAVVQSMMAGQADSSFMTTPTVQQHIKSGRMVGLAVTSPQRFSTLPDVPTTKEAGLPQMAGVNWNGIFVPTRTPQTALARLNSEITAVLNMPEVRTQFMDLSIEAAAPNTPEQARTFIEDEINRWAGVVKAGNIKIE